MKSCITNVYLIVKMVNMVVFNSCVKSASLVLKDKGAL